MSAFLRRGRQRSSSLNAHAVRAGPPGSNAKALWANSKPMDCEERLITQAAMTKAANPNTRVCK